MIRSGKGIGKTKAMVIGFALVLGLMIMVSLSMGFLSIPIKEILLIISGKLFNTTLPAIPMAETYTAVIFDVRLPRILTCAWARAIP